jgi:hypothetical protein
MGAIEKDALDWNPQGVRRRGRPKTWKRTIEEKAAGRGKTWKEIKAMSAHRTKWRSFTEALCSARSERNSMTLYFLSLRTLCKVFKDKFDATHAPNDKPGWRKIGMLARAR